LQTAAKRHDAPALASLQWPQRPAPQRSQSSWRAFLANAAASILACDFLTVETAFLQRIYVLFFISLATRRIEYIGPTVTLACARVREDVPTPDRIEATMLSP
jgi:hypothetical protein